MKERLVSVFTLGGLLLIIVAMCVYISGIDDRKDRDVTTSLPAAELTQTVTPATAPSVPATVPAVTTTLAPAVT